MIYELRIYTAHPGKLPALTARFRDHTTRLFEKHGIKNVGYWTNAVGGRSDELVYMLGFQSMGASRDCMGRVRCRPGLAEGSCGVGGRWPARAPRREPLHGANRLLALGVENDSHVGTKLQLRPPTFRLVLDAAQCGRT